MGVAVRITERGSQRMEAGLEQVRHPAVGDHGLLGALIEVLVHLQDTGAVLAGDEGAQHQNQAQDGGDDRRGQHTRVRQGRLQHRRGAGGDGVGPEPLGKAEHDRPEQGSSGGGGPRVQPGDLQIDLFHLETGQVCNTV